MIPNFLVWPVVIAVVLTFGGLGWLAHSLWQHIHVAFSIGWVG